MNKKIIFLTSLAACLMITACAPPRPAAAPPENQMMPKVERQKEMKKISSWELSGAMAAKNKNKGWSATLNWLQKGINNYQLRLFGPLGSGTVIIDKKGSTITYRDGPKAIQSQNASQLLLEQTGIRLPVNSLYYWVRGLAAPGTVQSSHYDRYNHLETLQQQGYTIHYLRYTSVAGRDLPAKIQLQGKDLFVKLIIKRWKI